MGSILDLLDDEEVRAEVEQGWLEGKEYEPDVI